ncbi:MAG: ABC transporter substrate-binding protein [Candidatus Limnocylindria bacterium]
MRFPRWLLTGPALVTIVVAACGGGAGPGPAAKPDVTVASFNFAESRILAELYGQVLEANGYKVERKHNLGNREIVFPAIENGDINFVPEYLATVLAFATKATTHVADAAQAHRQLQEAVRAKGLTVLDFAPAVDTNAFVVTKATAQRYRLTKMSDLAAVAGELTLGGPPECPQRPFCIQGLRQTYGITFKEFRPLDPGGPLTVAAVEAGQVQVGLLFSTDAQIAAKGFVLLEDDKKLQAADNVVPLVRQRLADGGGEEFRRLVNGVSAKLTTAKLTDLNKQVAIDRKEPRDVARDWLKAEGLVR